MSDISETFFTVIGCMDGRIQAPLAQYGREKFGAEFPDTITEAGMAGLLSKEVNPEIFEGVKKKLMISIDKHHSKGVIINGHQKCAGNPVSDDEHKEDILKTADLIRQIVPEGIEVLPVLVVEEEGNWKINPL